MTTAPMSSPHVADDRLDDYVDGLLDAPTFETTRAHLADCAACGARLAELRDLLALSTAERRAVEPPAELWPLVVASTIEGARVRRRVLRSMRAPLLVMAALLVALSSAATAWVVTRASAVVHGDAVVPSLTSILEEDAAAGRSLAAREREPGAVAPDRIHELRQRLAAADAALRNAPDDEALYGALAMRERVMREVRPVLGGVPQPPRAPRAPLPPVP